MQLTSPIISTNNNCISNSANNNNNGINNNTITTKNDANMVVSESNKSPSHIISLFNHTHHTNSTNKTSSSATSATTAAATSPTTNICMVPRDTFFNNTTNSCTKKVLGVILIDERMMIRHLCRSSDLIDLEYKNYLLLGSIVVDKETISIEELRRLIADQITNLPKNYAFFSKEGWPLTKSQECKLKFFNLINKRNIICIRKVYDKPRIGVLTDAGEYLGSLFINTDCTLNELRRALDDIIRDPETTSKLSKILIDYRFIDRNEWPVNRSHEDQLTLLDVLVNQNVLIRPSFCDSFTSSSCPAIRNVNEGSEGKMTPLTPMGKSIAATPTSTEDRIDGWKVDASWRRSSKKRNIMVTQVENPD